MACAYDSANEETSSNDYRPRCGYCSNRQPVNRICGKCEDFYLFYCIGERCWRISRQTKFSWICPRCEGQTNYKTRKCFIRWSAQDVRANGRSKYPYYTSVLAEIKKRKESQENEGQVVMVEEHFSLNAAQTEGLPSRQSNPEEKGWEHLRSESGVEYDWELVDKEPKPDDLADLSHLSISDVGCSNKETSETSSSSATSFEIVEREEEPEAAETENAASQSGTSKGQECDNDDKKPKEVSIFAEYDEYILSLGPVRPWPEDKPRPCNPKYYDLFDENGEWKKNKEKKDDEKDDEKDDKKD